MNWYYADPHDEPQKVTFFFQRPRGAPMSEARTPMSEARTHQVGRPSIFSKVLTRFARARKIL